MRDPTGEAAYVDVLVAGAGVVGLACARALQRSGLGVCVADPEAPGSVCSAGNAGIIASDHVLPLARPEVLRRVPRMLLDRRAALSLKPSRLPALVPWMVRFAGACRPARVAAGTAATAALTRRAVAAWQEELTSCGAAHLLRRQGLYGVYTSAAALHADAGERERQRELGVDWQLLDGDELRRREPALSDGLRHAVFYPEAAHVLSPAEVSRTLADALARDGGTIRVAAVADVAAEPHQLAVRLTAGRIRCRYLIVAAGLGSRALCAGLGSRLPLAAEMGYHLQFPGAERLLRAPVAAAERGFIVTPMEGHLRSAGTVELAAREMAPDWARADRLEAETARLFRDPLPPAGPRWRGSRPTLPDFLPAIGALPGQPRVIAAFGHNHIGLTTAAVTGALVRDLVHGARPALDMAPYHPGRFAFHLSRSRTR